VGLSSTWKSRSELPVHITGNIVGENSIVPLSKLNGSDAGSSWNAVLLEDNWFSDGGSGGGVIFDELGSPVVLDKTLAPYAP
jgi:hypothetical protein